MPFEDYTTVEETLDGDVILVGEEHTPPGAEYSEDLADRVLQEYEPQTIAIESYRPRNRSGGAMGRVADYASDEGVPLVAIDNSNPWHRLDCSRSNLMERANHFSHPIQEDGDLDPAAIYDARERIRDEFGDDAREMMFENRENAMAARLRGLRESTECGPEDMEYESPIVAAIGTFHIRGIRDRLEENIDLVFVRDERIHAE